MKNLITCLLGLSCLAGCICTHDHECAGMRELFNGRDLTNW